MAGDDEHDLDDDAPDPAVAPGPELDAGIAVLLADAGLWVETPDDLGDRVVAAVRSEAVVDVPSIRRGAPGWIRPAVLGAAAVVVFLLVGIVALSALDGPAGSDRFAGDLVPTGLVDDVDGTITMTSFESGLRIDLDAPNLPRREGGQFYEAWLRTFDGTLVPCGTFHGGDAVVLWAGIDREDVAAFSVTMEEAAMPDSDDHGSSGRVVLKADIPAP